MRTTYRKARRSRQSKNARESTSVAWNTATFGSSARSVAKSMRKWRQPTVSVTRTKTRTDMPIVRYSLQIEGDVFSETVTLPYAREHSELVEKITTDVLAPMQAR